MHSNKRLRIIAGNWKMNTTLDEAVYLVNDIRYGVDELENVETVICRRFISLARIKEILTGSSIKLGAQDVFYEEKGAYTGEISPAMIPTFASMSSSDIPNDGPTSMRPMILSTVR